MKLPNGYTLQSENTKELNNNDLNKIHEIEQDMWAEGIGEYVKCPCCNTIYSKKDIFGHLETDIYKETVGKIEQILDISHIKCKKCNSNTDFIWGTEYLDQIKERYQEEKSFLTTMRDDTGEILGFSDGYIADFDTIYRREFEYYYSNIGAEEIKRLIRNKLLGEFPDIFLMHSVIALEVKYSNLQTFLAIIQHFYLNFINIGHTNITGIYEAHIGNIAHSIYHTFGGQEIGINNNKFNIYNRSENNISDILIQNDVINTTLYKLSTPYKKFVKENGPKMKEVLIKKGAISMAK